MSGEHALFSSVVVEVFDLGLRRIVYPKQCQDMLRCTELIAARVTLRE